jgi:hypothetical protein
MHDSIFSTTMSRTLYSDVESTQTCKVKMIAQRVFYFL